MTFAPFAALPLTGLVQLYPMLPLSATFPNDTESVIEVSVAFDKATRGTPRPRGGHCNSLPAVSSAAIAG